MRESDLLQHIYQANQALPGSVTIPPGDDMGAVQIGSQAVLVAVDQVADGVHVDVSTTPLAKIGRKAITRNLSDIAAMAASPVAAVAAASLPRDFGEQRTNELFDAMRATAEHFGCPLIGGDIAMWDGPLLLTVTVFAEPAGIEPVTRKGAKVGDSIYVTGSLGGSLETVDGYTHHLDFEPRLSIARLLANNPKTRPNCMIDISDGLACDLGHLCEQSGVWAMIDAAQLPIRTCAKIWQRAVGDGEDYELCFTIDRERARLLPSEIQGVKVTRIGVVEPGNSGEPGEPGEPGQRVCVRLADGEIHNLTDQGWEHRGS